MNDNPSQRRSLTAAFLAVLSIGAAAHAAEVEYQYFRFTQTELRNPLENSIQLAEFDFTLNGVALATDGVIVTNPDGESPGSGAEDPEMVIDGSVDTKWLDFNKESLVFQFPAPVTIDGYNFATANDATGRDPVSWMFYGSEDGVTWDTLHVVTDYPTITTRQTYEAGFTIPEALEPLIVDFSTVPTGVGSAPTVLVNGGSADLQWEVQFADEVTLDSGTGPETVDASGFQTVVPPPNADTVYTLTATNATGTDEGQILLRTVEGGSVEFRYVRFTPIKLRDDAAANSIQLGEFIFLNEGTFLTVDSVTNPGGDTPELEGPDNAIDGTLSAKWLDFNKSGLIFDFGAPTEFDHYGLGTANDAPARDPVRWLLEGRNSEEEPWTIIDNMTAFDFPLPTERVSWTQDIPLPGSGISPYVVAINSGGSIIPGESLTLNFEASGATSLSADNGIGDLPLVGTVDVSPTETTTYTFTASNAEGATATTSVTVEVLPPPTIDTIAYTNFNDAGSELSLLGVAGLVSDPTRPLPAGEPVRLRLTPDLASQSGVAWFRFRQDLAEGFETNFDIHLTSLGNGGADGMSFIIQNHPDGRVAAPTELHENGLPTEALNIKFDSYQNEGEPSAGFIQVLAGTTVVAEADLAANPAITFHGSPPPEPPDATRSIDMTDDTALAAPYAVRVTYTPGNLSVFFEGVEVIQGANVDLAAIGAVDEEGTALVGFAARTGGLFEAHDVTRWFLTEGAPTPPAGDLMLVNHSFNFADDELTLTWQSAGDATYSVATSDDLINWVPLQSGIESGGATTSTTVDFTQATRAFFRVEEE